MPTISVRTQVDTAVVAERAAMYAQNSLFSDKIESLSFPLTDINNTQRVLMSFTIAGGEGRVQVGINGQFVIDSPIVKGNIQPITLPLEKLRKSNQITITVSSPGIKFWKSHDISIENLKVISEVRNVAAQSSSNSFVISSTEYDNIEVVDLTFFPQCETSKIGPLSIDLNEKNIYNSLPDCDAGLLSIEFGKDRVKQGDNTILFSTQRGSYTLSNIEIESKLKDLEVPTYYFDLAQEDYETVTSGSKKLRLYIDFVDTVDRKVGRVILNGKSMHFDTDTLQFVIDGSGSVVKGTNSIKIKPQKSMEIRELRAVLG